MFGSGGSYWINILGKIVSLIFFAFDLLMAQSSRYSVYKVTFVNREKRNARR